MIDPAVFFELLEARKVGLYVGVPDSLLASFCAYVDDAVSSNRHVIAANEGNAVAIALGHYLATGNSSVVYMQNSGLGNVINPLTSLADREVYSVPMLLVIGWRGEPGVHDEPQHVKQGRITPGQLELMEIPYFEVSADSSPAEAIDHAFARMGESHAPVALLVHKNAFKGYMSRRSSSMSSELGRESAIECLLDLLQEDDLVVSTTGKASRELFELRSRRGQGQHDFLTVGGMGHTSSIALGLALGKPDRRVVCIDGDGSLLMHMGSMAINGSLNSANLIHVVLNNASHESVGGQPTVADRIDIGALAKACGYLAHASCNTAVGLKEAWRRVTMRPGLVLLEVRVAVGARADLGRPTSSPIQNKQSFMRHVGSEN